MARNFHNYSRAEDRFNDVGCLIAGSALLILIGLGFREAFHIRDSKGAEENSEKSTVDDPQIDGGLSLDSRRQYLTSPRKQSFDKKLYYLGSHGDGLAREIYGLEDKKTGNCQNFSRKV